MPAPRTEFRLVTTIEAAGVKTPLTVVIEEPVKWDQVTITAKRDPKYHGFLYVYSDGKIPVEFTCESAGNLLRTQYYTYGNDALVKFQLVRIASDATEIIRYAGKIDFNEIELLPGKVRAEITRDELVEKLQAREDSAVSMTLEKTLDNALIIPPKPIQLALPGQAIKEKAAFKRTDNFMQTTEFVSPNFIERYIHLPNMVAPLGTPVPTGPIDPITGQPAPATPDLSTLEGILTYNGGVVTGNYEDFEFMNCNTAGTIELRINWVFQLNMVAYKYALRLQSGKFLFWEIRPVLIIARPNEHIEIIELTPPARGGGERNETRTKTISCGYQGTIDYTAGTKIYLQDQVTVNNDCRTLIFDETTISLRVDVTRVTRAAPSKGYAYSFPDALRHVFGMITSAVDGNSGTGRITGSLVSGKSNTQAMDGYATEYAVSSGFQLRNLTTKAPTMTWKQLMGTLWAQHAAGLLIQRDSNDNYSVRIEEGTWFYRGGEILVLDEVYAYEEKPNPDLLANQIIVGYDKFSETGPGALESFNTLRTYQTPIVTHQLTKEIKCPLIADGNAIEEARRLGIPQTDADGKPVDRSTEGGTYDDDLFLLHVEPQVLTGQVQFFVHTFSGPPFKAPITFNVVCFIGPNSPTFGINDVFTISGTGSANDGKTVTVISPYRPDEYVAQQMGLPTTGYWVSSPLVATQVLNITYLNVRQPLKIRSNTRLKVYGVTEPDSTYNLELSPARMLRRHAPFLNSGFFYKQGVDELRCTDYKGNRDMTSKTLSGMGPLPGDPDSQIVKETGNIALGEFNRFSKIFSPELIPVKVWMTRLYFEHMMLALENAHPDETLNMGYLTIQRGDDPDNRVSGYPFSISFNPYSNVCDITLWKKSDADNLGGGMCTDYPDWVISQFQNQNPNPNRYRFCRFTDFN